MLAESYLPRTGGGVRYEADVVRYFRRLGHTVDVLTVNHAGQEGVVEYEAVGRVIRLPRLMEFDRALLSAHFPGYLRQHIGEYDLVHFNCPNPIGEIAYLFARLAQRMPPTLCFIHHEVVSAKRFNRLYNGWFFPLHLRAMDRLVVSSPNFAASNPLLTTLAHKTVVIPFGIDPTIYHPQEETSHPPGAPLRLVFVGRIVRYKGLSYLLDALAQVENVTLEIVGEGPLLPELKRQTAALGLARRVRFTGYVLDDALPSIYQQADVVVLCSIDRGESFGYVVLEGMASGLAAITTEIGTGTSFVNAHGESGLVVPPRDAQALALAIRTLAADRTMLRTFQRQARRRVLEHFTIDRMLEQTAALYREMGVGV
jgi:rhamnosyl/mannosyltransferase